MKHSLILCQTEQADHSGKPGEFFTLSVGPKLKIVQEFGPTFYGIVETVMYRHPQPKVCRAVITFVTGTSYDVACHHVPDVYKHDFMRIEVKKRWSRKRGHYFDPVIAVYRRHVINAKKKRKQK
jgi:hypothetical protein